LSALPLVAPDEKDGRNPVMGVLYIDSKAESFFLDGSRLDVVVNMMERFAANLDREALSDIDHISNRKLARGQSRWYPAGELPADLGEALESVETRLPTTKTATQFNLEYSDFIPVGETQ